MIKKWISWILLSIDKRLKLNLFQNMASKLISEDFLKYRVHNAPYGIYLYATDGYLYDPRIWNPANNSNAVGVGLIGECMQYVLHLEKTGELPCGIQRY